MKNLALIRFALAALAVMLLCALPSQAQAAEPIHMIKGSYATLNVPFHAPTIGAANAAASQPNRMRQLELTYEVVKPVRSAGRKLPVVYVIHGGGWWGGSRMKMRPFTYPLAKAGYVTVSVEYRLSCKRPGNPYIEQRQSVRADYFPNSLANEGRFCGYDMDAMIEDVHRGYDWTLRNVHRFGGDPERVSVLGASAGAHLATMLVDNAPQSLILFSVPANLAIQAQENAGVEAALANTLGCAFEACPGTWRAHSAPTVFGEHRPAPTFFTGGMTETITPYSDALRYGRAIKAAGGQTWFRYSSSACHGTSCLNHHAAQGGDIPSEMLAFLARYG